MVCGFYWFCFCLCWLLLSDFMGLSLMFGIVGFCWLLWWVLMMFLICCLCLMGGW